MGDVMTKEELLPLVQADRLPIQQILEVISFRPSDRGIEGELYLVTLKMRTVRYNLEGVDDCTFVGEDMPYPLGPAKAIHDAKIDKMMEGFSDNLKKYKDITNKKK